MVHITEKHCLFITGLPEEHRYLIQKSLTLANPVYAKMLRNPEKNRRALFGIKKDFKYYRYDKYKDIFVVPKGVSGRVLKHLEKHGIEYTIDRIITEKKRTSPILSTITLRDYQKPILDSLKDKTHGLVYMSTGAGKTIVALDYIAKSGLTATIIVHNKVLLNQFKEKCKELLSFTPAICGEGKKEIGDITIATIQTLKSDPVVREKLAAQTSVLIVDEAQDMISDLTRGVLESFTPKYMFGLTGTPMRSNDDGQTDAIKFTFGPIVAEHQMEQMPPTIMVFMTDVYVDTEEYPDMQYNLINHHRRNQLIAGCALGEMLSGKKVLILTKRIAHYELLRESYIGECDKYFYVNSKDSDRDDILYGLTNGTTPYSLIAGTYSLLGTGFDVQSLEVVLLAGDIKSNVKTTQSIGRALRLLKGKNPIIYDFCDNKTPTFKRQFQERLKIYREKGWKIEYHGISEAAANKWL